MSKIREYIQVVSAQLNDLFVIDRNTSGTHTTNSVSVEQIGDAIFGAKTAGDLPLGSTTPSGSTAEAIGAKATTGSAITFTPETGVTANLTSTVINKCAFITLTFTGSFTQNTWTKVGTMNVTPYNSTVYCGGVHSADGLYGGMIQIRSDKGIYFYPKIAITGTVGCTANFNIT